MLKLFFLSTLIFNNFSVQIDTEAFIWARILIVMYAITLAIDPVQKQNNCCDMKVNRTFH